MDKLYEIAEDILALEEIIEEYTNPYCRACNSIGDDDLAYKLRRSAMAEMEMPCALCDGTGLAQEADEGLAEALTEAWEAAEGSLNEKVSNIVKLLRSWGGVADMIKTEEERLRDRRKSLEKKQERLREYLLGQLQRVKSETLRLDVATVSRAKGRERVEIDDELTLPQGYFTTDILIKPDKKSLGKLWKETDAKERDALPGFHVERGPESLSIR